MLGAPQREQGAREVKASLLIVVLCLLAVALPAQETERKSRSDEELREAIRQEEQRIDDMIVVTATRHARRPLDVPGMATVEAGEVLDRARTVQDALRETPGVQLQRTSYGQTSPFMRGFTGYHTLMMVDGIRLNNSVLRSGPNEYWGLVDALSLDRVEVILGPASVLYGSDAVGGSVNAIPRRRREYGEGWGADLRTYLRFSSAENSITGRTEVSGNMGQEFGFVVGGTAASFGDLKAGGDVGRQPHTGYSQQFGDVALDFNLDDHWTVDVLGQLARVDNVGRTPRPIYAVGYHGTTGGSELRRNYDWDRELAAVRLTGRALGGFVDGVKARFSFQRIGEDRDRVRGDGRRDLQGFDVDTYGLSLELTSETSIGRLTYGADWYHDEVSSYRDNFDATGAFTGSAIQGPVGDDARYDLLGVFLQDEVPLGDDLDLVLGGRLTYAAADADSVEDPDTGDEISLSDDWFSAVGSVRLLWSPTEEVRFFGGVSQAFRAPNLSDLSRLDSARSNEIEVPSPDLEPEDFISFELGSKLRWSGLSLDLAYHYTLLDDVIIRQPTGAMIGTDFVVAKRNGGDGHVQGIDVAASYAFDDNWSAFAMFQWLDGHQETFPTSAPMSVTEPLSRLSPLNGILGVRWQTDDRRFWVRAWTVVVDEQDRLNTRDQGDTSRIPPGGTPGYTVFNLEAGYALSEDQRFFLALENITDKNYRVHGSGLQEPGVNVIVGADFSF